ncbi:MAG TPA: SIMPL domain-containing protein, partial [Gemmobacter sp.]|nr:SIMPL domain-containing protein [Gemmobacter sp.]
MRILSTLALAAAFGAAALVAPVAALAGQITVTGEGRIQAAPDMATITLGVTTQGATAAEAMAANSAELAKVMDRLKTSGIEARDMQTTGLSLYPEWRQSADGQSQQIGGYTASNTLTLRIRALDTLGGVLDSAIQDGANTLNGVEFGLSNPRPAED